MKRSVQCGNVVIGGDAPVSIQSMLTVDTRDVPAALDQIERLREAGCDIVRLTVPDMEAAEAFGRIKQELVDRYREKSMPLVADVHFDYRLAVQAIHNGADKVRINPGNIGEHIHIKAIADAAKARGIPIRVGVNGGSIEKDILERDGRPTAEGMAESALRCITRLEEMDFEDIVVSIKASNVKLNYDAHILLNQQTDHPIHIGITESGTLENGRIKSAVGIGALLLAGIGNTMRVSITGDPVVEVIYAKKILEAAGMRNAGINIISCPTCGRTKVNLEKMADELAEKLAPVAKKREREGKGRLTIAVMGCAVNGPGEAREADLGVACGDGKGVLFSKGQVIATFPEQEIVEEIIRRAEENYTI